MATNTKEGSQVKFRVEVDGVVKMSTTNNPNALFLSRAFVVGWAMAVGVRREELDLIEVSEDLV